MRIIFLNCYSGQILTPLLDFITKQGRDTDIFCFSEMSENLQKRFTAILQDFSSVFEIGGLIIDCNELAGQSTFVRKDIEIIDFKKIAIHEIKNNDVGFLLKTTLKAGSGLVSLGNVHGTSRPSDKRDSDIRLKQSEIIIDSFRKGHNKIIIGDFNLNPDTKSVKMFEKVGYKNLIRDFGIKNTRNEIAWNRFKDGPDFVKQYYSDYCFVSPEVKVKNFEVPYNEISDHLPLILDFKI